MKKYWILAGMVLWSSSPNATRAQNAAAPSPNAVVAAAAVEKTLQQISEEVQYVLVEDQVFSLFDWYRKLKDFGLTYQPSLAAPNDLSGQLDGEQLRLYAGVKLFDALYAVTFMQRQEAADCVRVIEEIEQALDLRSFADLDNHFLATLKKAANNPEEVDVQSLIRQLANDYVKELPALLSSTETADYLIDGLYGAFIEQSYILSGLLQSPNADQIQAGFEQCPSQSGFAMLLDLFGAFDRLDEEIRVGGETAQKLDVIRELHRLDQADEANAIDDDEAEIGWQAAALKVAAIRAAILTPEAD